MIDDTSLTLEEKKLLEESYVHEREGKLISSKKLHQFLGLCKTEKTESVYN